MRELTSTLAFIDQKQNSYLHLLQDEKMTNVCVLHADKYFLLVQSFHKTLKIKQYDRSIKKFKSVNNKDKIHITGLQWCSGAGTHGNGVPT